MKTTILLFVISLLGVGVYGQVFETQSGGDWTDPNNWSGGSVPTFGAGEEINVYHEMTNIPAAIVLEGTLGVTASNTFYDITGSGTFYLYYDVDPLQIHVDNISIKDLVLDGNGAVELNVSGNWGVGSIVQYSTNGHEINYIGSGNITTTNDYNSIFVNFTGNYYIQQPISLNYEMNIISGTTYLQSVSSSSFSKTTIHNGAIFNLSSGSAVFQDLVDVSGQLIDNHADGTIIFNDSLVVNATGIVNTSSNVTEGYFTINNGVLINGGSMTAGSIKFTGTNTYINGTSGILINNNLSVYCTSCTNNITAASGGITVNGDITTNTAIGSRTLVNKGLINYKGTATPMSSKTLTTTDANSEFVYGGSSAQSIKATNYYKLKINNAAGASLPGSITVLNNLNLTSGIVTPTNLSFVLTVNDNATASNASSSSFIAGKCKKIGNDAFTFPVGKSGHYSPVTITAPSLATDAFTVEYFFADPQSVPYNVNLRDAGLSQISRREYWMVDRTTGSSSIDVALTWNSARSGDITDINDLRVVHWNGSSWEDKGQNNLSGDANSGEIRSNTNSSFSPFTIGSSSTENPLPVSLVSFDVFCPGQNNIVTWQTASETNASYFDLEGSTDGETWYVRGTVESARNSNSIKQYSVIDPKQVNEIKYYRLRQFDVDGRFSYSHIIQVGCTIDGMGDVKIFPNPATDIITLNGSNSIIGSTAYIYNSLNQLVGEYKIGESTTNIDIESLPSGIYILQVRDGSRNILNHRLVVE